MQFKNWLENYEFLINEIDWEGDFSDVKKQCVHPKEVAEYLNAVKANASRPYGKREKFPANKPFVHSKSSFFNKDQEDVDIDYFIEKITASPRTVISQTTEKIKNSGGIHQFVYKTGIPAFRGIAYDIKNQNFVYINTCPGAGACVAICYARRGRYLQYPDSYDSMTRRLNLLLNNPKEYERRLYEELENKAIKHQAIKGYKPEVILRWNDSGDFFGKKYSEMSSNVIKKLQLKYNVKSYAYTKTKENPNFVQMTASDQPKGKFDFKKKTSKIVPKEIFKGLSFLKIEDEKQLKKNVAKYFSLPIDLVLTYDEMKSMPEGDSPKWHVIVTPEDGDDAAFRKDVLTILLTEH